MTPAQKPIDVTVLRVLTEQGRQLLDQVPPSRHIRRLATAIQELGERASQPVRLAILGIDEHILNGVKAKLAPTLSSLEVRCVPYANIVQCPRLLCDTVNWGDAALFLPTGAAARSCLREDTLSHCFRNSIVLEPTPDGRTRACPNATSWAVAADHWDSLSERLAIATVPLKRLASAQRLASCARRLKQMLAQSSQHYKLVLNQMEKPTKPSASRQNNVDSDKIWLPMRDAFAERMVTLERELVTTSERATQPLGDLTGLLRSIVNGVSEEDLENTRTSSQLKLSVNAGHLATLNRRFEHTLYERFTRDLKQAQRLVRAAMDESFGRIANEQKLNDSKLPAIEISRAWLSVENLMAIGKEAAIELPRKGIFDLLTAGRQKVFIIIMFVSLMGRMGLPKLFTTPVAQLGFGLFMASVMIVSMVSAIGRWRKENAQTVEKELQKFRDCLLAEGGKVIDQVERVKLNAIRDYCKEAARSFESICKTQIESTIRLQQVRSDELQQRQETTRKNVEGRLKQLAELERPVQRFIESVESHLEDCRTQWQAVNNSTPEPELRPDKNEQSESKSIALTKVSANAAQRTKASSALAVRRAQRMQA